MAAKGNSGKKPTPPSKSAKKAKEIASTPKQSVPDFVSPVREILMVRVSREIDKRGWTQAQAAKFLRVTQPRISDLSRGHIDKFTIDMLVQWLGMLGKETSIDTKGVGSNLSISACLDASEDAIPYYTKVIAANPTVSENYRKRAYAYHRYGQYDLAIGDYTRAMELNPDFQYLRINRAQSYLCLGQYAAAFHDCDQLIAKKPEPANLAWAYITRASAQQALSKYEEAMQEYAKAIEVAPNYISGYLHRGMLHQRLSSNIKALADFSKVLELQPNHAQAQKCCEDMRKLI